MPFGRYRKPYFPAAEMAHFLSRRAGRSSFAPPLVRRWRVRSRGMLYCDPPYAPLSATANFTSYSVQPFGVDEQRALARLAEKLAGGGVTVIISNHDTEFTRREYAQARIVAFDVLRTISCDGSRRGAVGELLAIFDGDGAPRPAR